ncbi:hypothetical protein DACRYDRAFT_104517 [Dacryopinax primogenitus]|uniref:Uncharacterized protein n=1 Tax=Dacryopinax primogenitus (strain DJM 731) TaxID=1858805 RepID=M5G8X4_DACPD|nr:uncharacterized protein DACRYDRAFT_104517 [Dacryopinax primogenitus]EJU04635.1 hypothetical protein DACRYDRAFT_104517 [Dacryopinax primogenitus]
MAHPPHTRSTNPQEYFTKIAHGTAIQGPTIKSEPSIDVPRSRQIGTILHTLSGHEVINLSVDLHPSPPTSPPLRKHYCNSASPLPQHKHADMTLEELLSSTTLKVAWQYTVKQPPSSSSGEDGTEIESADEYKDTD